MSSLLIAADRSEAEHRVRGSRFLAVASPAVDFRVALEQRDRQRRRFRDASHHVWGAILVGGDRRSDDDGEPSGTGGRQVLAAIDRAGIRDVVVVVTRYFGGVKLGMGGLSRAYGRAASLALRTLSCRRVASGRLVRLEFDYELTGVVSRVLETTLAERLRDDYGERATMDVAVSATEVESLRDRLRDATAGRLTFVDTGERALVRIAT